MARSLRRKPLLSRLFTTYLTLVVVVMFTGIVGAVPVSFAEEDNSLAGVACEATGTAEPSVGGVSELSDDEAAGESDDLDEGSSSDPNSSLGFLESPGERGGEPEADVGQTSLAAEPMCACPQPSPSGHGVSPDRVKGNPDCSDVCTTGDCREFKIDRMPTDGTYDVKGDGTITITKATNSSFDWSASGFKVYYVIVKGGNYAHIYDYSHKGGVAGDSNLVSPINQNNCKYYDISHVTFCYKPCPPPPKPSIDIEKYTNGEDADTPTGPYIPVGDSVEWTYVVTNTGGVKLHNILVTDDQGVAISQPKNSLDPGESMTCTASGVAVAGQYANIGTVVGCYWTGCEWKSVSDSDPSHYFGVAPELTLVKEASPATYDAVGDIITYTYTLTNSGNVTLSGPFTVDDDKATTSRVDVVPDPDVLAPGDSATFSATYVITQDDIDAGSVTNIAQGLGFWGEEPVYSEVYSNIDDETVTAVQTPAIEIVKLTNDTDGALILVGADVTWSYLVTNTGNVTLTNVVVTDDIIGDIGTIPSLAPGASETLHAYGTAVAGQYANIGTATGTPPIGEDVSNSDDSSYFGSNPSISIEKSVDSDLVLEGEQVTYTFVVKNTGNVPLYNVLIEDDHLGVIATIPMLDVGAEQTFTRTVVILEPTTNVVVATGSDEAGHEVSDSDQVFVDIDEFLGFGPDLAAEKSADRTTADPGDIITYTVVIRNVGGDPAYDYVVEDTFDQRYLVVVDAAGGTVSNGKIVWNFAGPLAFGQTQTIVYKLMVAETMPDGRTVLDNTVVVTHPEDDNPDNDTSSWRVTVDVEEPFLPFTGAGLLGLLALAGATALMGAELRRRSKRIV